MNTSLISSPQIVSLPEATIAKLYAKVPTREIQSQMGPLLRELSNTLIEQQIKPVGQWFTHHFRRPSEFFDFEVCFITATPIARQGRVEPGTWPAMKAVRSIYTGPYDGLIDAWGEFMAYIEHEKLAISPEIYERYLINMDNEADPERWQTELTRPLL